MINDHSRVLDGWNERKKNRTNMLRTLGPNINDRFLLFQFTPFMRSVHLPVNMIESPAFFIALLLIIKTDFSDSGYFSPFNQRFIASMIKMRWLKELRSICRFYFFLVFEANFSTDFHFLTFCWRYQRKRNKNRILESTLSLSRGILLCTR